MKSVHIRAMLASFTGLLLVAGCLVGANAASADSVQVQSYQRASQSAACTAQLGETPWLASWGDDSSWHPSWEQWANGGAGGWTCTRSITWAYDNAAPLSLGCRADNSCELGSIGPGGGLVFLIDNGVYYEMAPKTWTVDGVDETTGANWCSDTSLSIPDAVGTAIGSGSANTTAMQSPACTSGAGVSSRAYDGGGFTDWYLPSQDELNAMCNYSKNPTTPSTGLCQGNQDSAFASSDYGFFDEYYWCSSQTSGTQAWAQNFSDGEQSNGGRKDLSLHLRPIRAF